MYGTEPVNNALTRTITTNAEGPSEKITEKAVGKEPAENRLHVSVLSNPVHGNAVELLIKGAHGEQVQIEVADAQGKIIGIQRIGQAGPAERIRLSVANTTSQFLFVRVSTSKETNTVKVVKAN